MPNYEIKIQVDISPTEQDVTSDVRPCGDGSFRVVMSHESGQSIDQCEQALLALNGSIRQFLRIPWPLLMTLEYLPKGTVILGTA